jgi:hypothetical protein
VFFNRFNAPEFISLPSVTTNKITVERSLANLGSTSMFYDRVLSKSFDSEIKNLPFSLALHLEQLIASPFVGYISTWSDVEDDIVTELPEILITDFTSEPQPDDDELNTLKLSWQFADSRRHAVIPIQDRIFNNSYTNQFS